MTASLHRLGTGAEAGNYYTNDGQREAKPRNRDEYYGRDGDGTWWSSGDTVVRHATPIDKATFRDLCAGIDPRTGRGLVREAGANHWAGLDCTLTPGKSVSLLWMAGTAEQRALIEDAHRGAVDDALRLIEREGFVVVRSGAGGMIRERPTDLIVARYDHYTTREGDPNLHTHCVYMNAAGAPRVSGRYKGSTHLTIETAALFHNQKVVGAAFRAALAERLHRHGFGFREAGRGQWEIAGVPQAFIERFSKRSHQIEERVGREASAAQKEIAALATRASKSLVPSGEDLEARWRVELASDPVDPWSAARTHAAGPEQDRDTPLDRGTDMDPPEVPGATPVTVAASALFRHDSVITRGALLERALVEAGLRGIGIAPVYEEIARLEADGTLLRLGPAQDVGQHWTTASIAGVEADMLRAANRPAERAWFDTRAVDAALGKAPHLSAEQRDVVRHAANQDGISIVEAGAGTGKTTAARTIREAAEGSGLTVIGLSPSWVAATELGRSLGIGAHAIAKWRHDRDRGRGPALDERTVLLVDEAGMASMRDMAVIVTAARAAGSKVVLIGDSRQLESVPGGSALRALTELLRQNAVMEAVRRQAVDWQRAASVIMARGDAEAGLRAYSQQDRIEMVAGTAQAMQRTIEQWHALRAVHGDDVLIITRRNADASIINRAARAALRAEGRIHGDDVMLRSIDRENKPVDLSLAVGDVVRFGETLPALAIWNGNRGTIEAVNATDAARPILRIRLEDGRVVERPWQDFARPLPGRPVRPPRMVHAYAGTAYSVQGRTAAASVHYIGAATDAREIYVGLTRHRHDVRIVVERDRLDAACRLRQEDPRMPPTATALEDRLFTEASQTSEKANVIDFVADRQDFVATGIVTRPETRPERSTARLLQAARALREVMSALRVPEAVMPVWRLVENGIRLFPPMPSRLRDVIERLCGTDRQRSRTHDRDGGIDR